MTNGNKLFRNSNGSFTKGFNIQLNVTSALIYRELKTRVSEVKFGVLGVFIEPLGVMVVFLTIFSLLRGRNNTIDIVLFLGSGIVLYTLFNEVAIRSLNAMKANEALFFYRPVKPIDTVIARAIVETGLYGIVYIVIICAVFLLREELILEDFPLLVVSFLALALNATGFGLIFMVAGFRYEFLFQIVPLALRPLWFISGVFFSLNAIPQRIIPFLSWNPIVQAIELNRYAFTHEYIIDKNVVSLWYLISCSLITFTFGLFIYTNNEKLLLTR